MEVIRRLCPTCKGEHLIKAGESHWRACPMCGMEGYILYVIQPTNRGLDRLFNDLAKGIR